MDAIKVLILSLLLTSCAWFDSGEEEIIADYTVGWIDVGCSMTIVKGNHGQMEGQIYAVGWNEQFIIAKRHPKCNKDVTDYFIIDIEKNTQSLKAGVFGPFNKNDFVQQRKSHKVPNEIDFSLEP